MSKKYFIAFGFVVFAAFGYFLYMNPPSSNPSTAPIPQPRAAITDKNTVAHAWNWESFKKPAKVAEGGAKEIVEEEVPYDVVYIYDKLQEVRLDQDGRVVLDGGTRMALEAAYSDLGKNLSPGALAQLQELIRTGLPGPGGEHAAELLANYYAYRSVEHEILAQANTQNIQGAAQNYEQIMELRRGYLGQEAADKLFAEEEAQAKHMMDVIALSEDTGLSEEEKAQRREVLQKDFEAKLAEIRGGQDEIDIAAKVAEMRAEGASEEAIFELRENALGQEKAQALAKEDADWQRRYSDFSRERNLVLGAGLAEQDKLAQIESLETQYFTPAELERLRHADIMRELEKTQQDGASDDNEKETNPQSTSR